MLHRLLVQRCDPTLQHLFFDVRGELTVEGSKEMFGSFHDDYFVVEPQVRVILDDILIDEVAELAGKFNGGRTSTHDDEGEQPLPLCLGDERARSALEALDYPAPYGARML